MFRSALFIAAIVVAPTCGGRPPLTSSGTAGETAISYAARRSDDALAAVITGDDPGTLLLAALAVGPVGLDRAIAALRPVSRPGAAVRARTFTVRRLYPRCPIGR